MSTMPKLLHVSNVDQSIQFYTEVFGMQLLRKQDFPDGRYTLASLGYNDDDPSEIELSHNWGADSPESASSAAAMRLMVDDAIKVCDDSKYAKGEVLRYFVDKEHHSAEAVLKDPDGYIIEVVQQAH